MPETPQSESVRDLVDAIDAKRLVLPEFQRDFVWDVSKTYDLLDSLARDVFVGPLIYGVPSFEVTARELDLRPRSGQGSRKRLGRITYKKEEIETLSRTAQSFRLILDGQQRITALFRTLKGADPSWFVALPSSWPAKFERLEDVLDEFTGQEPDDRISVQMAEVWRMVEGKTRREAEKRHVFEKSRFVKTSSPSKSEFEGLFERYLAITEGLQDLLKANKLLSYYVLDTSVEKFALFFERSNSKGVRLTFIDILAAKLYAGFNLRQHVEEFEEEYPRIGLNREHVVRMIAFIASSGKEVKKSYILSELTAAHFKAYWGRVTKLYATTIEFLVENRWTISQRLMPYDNMVVPIMVFLDHLPSKRFSQANANQLAFLEYWYWSSVFSERYSAKTNETILADANTLAAVARGKRTLRRSYARRFVSQVQTRDAIIDIKQPTSALFKGILGLVHRTAGGTREWKNGHVISRTEPIDSHHIFPRGYIENDYSKSAEERSLLDSVANRVYIPKITNIKIGKKRPSRYLKELAQDGNTMLEKTLESHLIDPALMKGSYDEEFAKFLQDRADRLFDAIQALTSAAATNAINPFRAGSNPKDSSSE